MRIPLDLGLEPFAPIDMDASAILGVTPIVGTDGDDFLDGSAGPDKIRGLGGNDLIWGEGGDDTLIGGGGNDTLYGYGGNDNLIGGGGDDYLRGYAGDDTFNGGAGYDAASIDVIGGAAFSIDLSHFHAGKTATFADGLGGTDTFISIERINITATVNDDTIIGAQGANGITTLGGNDYVDARGGDDNIVDYNGDATLLGGTGDDQIWIYGSIYPASYQFSGGHDHVDGGEGFDKVYIDWSLATSSVTLAWNKGIALASVGDGSASVQMTGIEALTVSAGAGGSTMQGGGGNDILIGGYGAANLIDGGGGNDAVTGGDQADSLSGGAGDDLIFGGQGNDTLAGGSGFDRYEVTGGAYDSGLGVVLIDMSGFDVSGASGIEDDQQGGLDRISGFEAVIIDTNPNTRDVAIGSAGDDIIYDSSGTDVLQGGAGDDVIYQTSEYLDGGSALDLRDTMDGGAGVDTLSFEKAFAATGAMGWAFDLKAGTVTGYNTGVDTISGFEHVIGSAAEDTIAGSNAAETLEGGGGSDVIQGRGGADVLTGGEDADAFVYASLADSGAGGRDLITDLTKEDVIDLSAIDADTTTGGDQAFHLVTTFGHHAGELLLTYDSATKTTLLAADVDGDGVSDFSVNLAGDQHNFAHFVF